MKTTLNYKSKEAVNKALKKAGIEISRWAQSLIDSKDFTLSKGKVEYEIVTVKDLGFDTSPTTTELFTQAKRKGYDLCPPDLAIDLAVNLELEKGTWVYLGMTPITDSDGDPCVFRVGRLGDGERWLRTLWAGPGDQWYLVDRIVWRRASSSLKLEPLNLALGTLVKKLRAKYPCTEAQACLNEIEKIK